MKCNKCGEFLAKERAEFLEMTNRPMVCVGCSSERQKLTLMEYGHKTAPSLVVIGDNHEAQRRAWAAYRRQR